MAFPFLVALTPGSRDVAMDKFFKCMTCLIFVMFLLLSFKISLTKFGNNDPIFEIMDILNSHDTVHWSCPGNFSLNLLTDGDYLYHIQSLKDEDSGSRNILRCERTPIEQGSKDNEALSKDVPWGAVQNIANDSDIFMKDALMSFAYIKTPSEAKLVPEANDHLLTGLVGSMKPGDMDHNTLFKGIFSGALWDRFGQTADATYNELDADNKAEIDRCAWSYNVCKPILKPIMTEQSYSVSHCACDVRLYNCFRRLNTDGANELANVIFNVARKHCFDFQLSEVCQEPWMGMCWKKEWACAPVIKENPQY